MQPGCDWNVRNDEFIPRPSLEARVQRLCVWSRTFRFHFWDKTHMSEHSK